MALLTLNEYKVFANITGILADARLTAIINSANQWFLTKLKRNIEEKSQEEYYDGDNTSELLLRDYPITELTELKIDDTLITATDYATYYSSGIIKMLYGIFSGGIQNVYVKYKSGFNPVPNDIKMAISELVSKKYESFDKKGNSFSSEAFMGGSLVFKDSDITEFMKMVLDNYRKKGKPN